jgi:purine-binding chemotaxis protein CheW
MSAAHRGGRASVARPIDWSAARARLAALARRQGQLLDGTEQLSPEETAALLRGRARALAATISAPSTEGQLEVVTFAAAGARYGIEGAYVSAVSRLGPLTRLPGVPPFVAGVTNHLGEIVMVADLSRLLGLAPTPTPPGALLLGLGARDLEPLAIIADTVYERIALPAGQLYPPGADGGGASRELRRAVTSDGCLILDGGALLRDPRLFPHRPN